jgi:hypothetical protein
LCRPFFSQVFSDDAGFNPTVLHDKIEEDERQGVVELDVALKSKAVTNYDEYAVANSNNQTMDVRVPDVTSLSTQAPGTDTLS